MKTIDDIQTLSTEAFIRYFQNVYYDEGLIARVVAMKRPFRSPQQLVQAFIEAVDTLPIKQKKALLQRQPQLGERLKALPPLKPHQFEKLMLFNTVYHIKFDYPFIISLKNESADEIARLLETRLAHTAQKEFCEAIVQLHTQAKYELAQLIETPEMSFV